MIGRWAWQGINIYQVCVCLAFCRWRTWVFVLKLNCIQSFSQPRIMSKRTHYIAVSLLSPIDLMNSL